MVFLMEVLKETGFLDLSCCVPSGFLRFVTGESFEVKLQSSDAQSVGNDCGLPATGFEREL